MQSDNILNIKEIRLKRLLDSSEFVSLVSYSNFDSVQLYEFKTFLDDLGFKIKFIQNKRLKSVLSQTTYKTIGNIFQSKILMIYSSDSNSKPQKELIKMINKSSNLVLLGCLDNGKYFHMPSVVENLLKLPDIFENQFQVYQGLKGSSSNCRNILNQSSQQLHKLLTHNQLNILNTLISKSK